MSFPYHKLSPHVTNDCNDYLLSLVNILFIMEDLSILGIVSHGSSGDMLGKERHMLYILYLHLKNPYFIE